MPRPKDFLETTDGLVFAVVDVGVEEGRVPCFLRYRKCAGGWQKLGSNEANALLAELYPHYRYYSVLRDISLHGVALDRVSVHHRPCQRLARLVAKGGGDVMEARLFRLLDLLAAAGAELDRMGVTGSMLIGAHRADSDFDLVVYERTAFYKLRQIVMGLLRAGGLQPLDDAMWRESYDRRGCALGYADYLRHEKRKFNKALFEGSKFDITLVADDAPRPRPCRKLGAAILTARVLDASHGFDHPARYALDHPRIGEALSYTQTYAGQAMPGEVVEIAGQLEETADGGRRIVVGGSREAPGEFIRLNSWESGE